MTVANSSCQKCGTSERYANGRCKACRLASRAKYWQEDPERARAQSRASNAANREKVLARQLAYREKNREKARATSAKHRAEKPDQVRATKAAYHAANKEKIIAQKTEFRKANPSVFRVRSQNARAKRSANFGKLSKDIAARLIVLQRGLCPCCKQPLGDNYHLDHIMPLALGGTNTDDNIQLLRAVCNNNKYAKHPVAFMQERGFLL